MCCQLFYFWILWLAIHCHWHKTWINAWTPNLLVREVFVVFCCVVELQIQILKEFHFPTPFDPPSHGCVVDVFLVLEFMSLRVPHEDHIYGRCKLFRDFHWRFLKEGVIVCVEVQRIVFWEIQGVQGTCRDAIRTQNQEISVGQWWGIHFQGIWAVFEGSWHWEGNVYPV